MVEQSRHWTNRSQVSDFLNFIPIPRAVNSAHIRDLYLKNGFTASQIAERVGLSKPVVLARLHQMGIRKKSGKGETVDNYRFAQRVPFEKQLENGRLMDDRKEIKTIRLIVDLRKRQTLPWTDVVSKLNTAGHRTKRGLQRKVGTARMIFAKWVGKF
jgi:hypothetical protein